jgi:hypothetical protein
MNAYHIIVSRQLSFAAFMMSRLVLVNFKLKRCLISEQDSFHSYL